PVGNALRVRAGRCWSNSFSEYPDSGLRLVGGTPENYWPRRRKKIRNDSRTPPCPGEQPRSFGEQFFIGSKLSFRTTIPSILWLLPLRHARTSAYCPFIHCSFQSFAGCCRMTATSSPSTGSHPTLCRRRIRSFQRPPSTSSRRIRA